MNATQIKVLLENAGLQKVKIVGDFIQFQDPSCVLDVLDKILNYGWFVSCLLTAVMLFGWGILYLRNGVKITSLFSNFKALLLILLVLSLTKPIVNVVYGDDLFAKSCETHQVSLTSIQELIQKQQEQTNKPDMNMQYEIFDVVDSIADITTNKISGVKITSDDIKKIIE